MRFKPGLTYWDLDPDNPGNPMHLHIVWAIGPVAPGSQDLVGAASVIQSDRASPATFRVGVGDHPSISKDCFLNLYPIRLVYKSELYEKWMKKRQAENEGRDYEFRVVENAPRKLLRRICEAGASAREVPAKIQRIYATALKELP